MNKCQRCGKLGNDRRTLWMTCLHPNPESPFRKQVITGQLCKQTSTDSSWELPVGESRPRHFHTIRVCKECQADWVRSIIHWLDAGRENQSFEDRLATFVLGCLNRVKEIGATIELAHGPQFIRVIRSEGSRSKSAYCFIAKTDGQTKYLGKYRAGDVFKPASWKRPARHARGNIFDAYNGLGRVNQHGAR